MARSRRSLIPRSATMWLCCCFAVRLLEAWIPPHPKSTIQWESVHDMRRRLQLDPFNYTTSRYMHPEMCRYLTEEECEEADTRMQEHIAAHRSLQQVQLRDDNPRKGAINVGTTYCSCLFFVSLRIFTGDTQFIHTTVFCYLILDIGFGVDDSIF